MQSSATKDSRFCSLTAKSDKKASHLSVVSGIEPNNDQSSKTAKSNQPPARKTNKEYRNREYLLPNEVKALIEAAKKTKRHGLRNEALITIGYQHALRVSELIAIRWDDINFAEGTIFIKRLKGSKDMEQDLSGSEIRLLKRLKRAYPDSPFVFQTERKGPLSARHVRTIVKEAGDKAGIENCHPHQLRHAKGYALVNNGGNFRAIQRWMGHANPMHTARYTELDKKQFKGFAEEI